MRKFTMFLMVALLSLALSAPAFGQSATEDAYSGTAGVQEFNDGGGDTAGTTGDVASQTQSTVSSSGVLPFTGLQLALIALAAVALLGVGLALRRGMRPDANA